MICLTEYMNIDIATDNPAFPSMPVSQADPLAGYLAHQVEIDAAIARVLSSGSYLLGEETRAFEAEFAHFVEPDAGGQQVNHGVAVANGTDALRLALQACGVGQAAGDVIGADEVIAPSFTATATIAAICQSGATPVFADIDLATYTLDPQCVRAALTPRTKAIVAVHLYGHPAPLAELQAIAAEHGLHLIEDCAQAHGATWAGKPVGSVGNAAAFSFYPTKNLAALGDAGMIVTHDARVAEQARLLRMYGWRQRYVSDIEGWNSRMDELQAAILRVKLRHLLEENARRQAIARYYLEQLADLPIGLPVTLPGCTHVYHQFVIRSAERDRLAADLKQQHIATAIHYPAPVHLQPAYARHVRGRLPHSEQAAREVLSLPAYPQLTDAQVERVAAAVQHYFEQRH